MKPVEGVLEAAGKTSAVEIMASRAYVDSSGQCHAIHTPAHSSEGPAITQSGAALDLDALSLRGSAPRESTTCQTIDACDGVAYYSCD